MTVAQRIDSLIDAGLIGMARIVADNLFSADAVNARLA